MGSLIGPKGLVLCSGCGLSLLGQTFSASRRPTVCYLLSVLRGFSLPVFLLLPHLGRLVRVVELFCFVLLSLVNSWCDVSGCCLQVEFSFFGSSFRVCCVYAPNRNPARDQFFGDLHSKIDPSIPTILCGDFNEVFDRSVDRAGSDPLVSPRDSSSSLTYLFDDCCVVDIWRYLHPSSVWVCRPLVFCPLSFFPGRFLLIPGFCRPFIPLFFWPGKASMVLLPRPVTLSFSVHPAIISAALWLICPQKAANCTFFPRTSFYHIVSLSFP